jgi:hypothetical protein
MMKKTFLFAAACMTLASAGTANATTFIGTTSGCFGAACVPGAIATDSGLVFTGGAFNQADSNGFLALGGSTDNLGAFTLDSTVRNYTGDLFTLLVNFTNPAGSGSANYAATLTGSVTGTNTGGVFINFDNNPISFNPPGGPVFTLAVNDVSVSAGAAAQQVSGQIQAAVPEPATWGMMLIGFGMIGAAMRRRRRQPGVGKLAHGLTRVDRLLRLSRIA